MFEKDEESSYLLQKHQELVKAEGNESEKKYHFPSISSLLVLIACVLLVVLSVGRISSNNVVDFEKGFSNLAVRVTNSYKTCTAKFYKGVSISKKPGCAYFFAHSLKGKEESGTPMAVVCSCDVKKPVFLDEDALIAMGLAGTKSFDDQVAVVATGSSVSVTVHHGKRFDGLNTEVKESALIKLEKLIDDQGFPIDNRARSISMKITETLCPKIKVILTLIPFV